jgi:hypothetical protein
VRRVFSGGSGKAAGQGIPRKRKKKDVLARKRKIVYPAEYINS